MPGMYNIHSLQLGTQIIGCIADQSDDAGIEVAKDPLDGELFPRMPVITAHNPTVTFTTYDLSLLGILGSIGTSVSEFSGGLKLFYKKRKPEGFFYPLNEAVHRSRTTTQGIIVPVSLSWTHNTPAQLQCQLFVSQDGVNDAWSVSDGTTLPALGTARLYSFGAAMVASKMLGFVNQCTFNFGVNVVGDETGGKLSNEINYYDQVQPTLQLTGKDLDWLSSSNLPENFATTIADTAVWFRQWIDEGKYYPPATANAVKLAISGLGYFTTTQGSGSSPATTSLTIDGRREGDNMPIVATNNVALPV